MNPLKTLCKQAGKFQVFFLILLLFSVELQAKKAFVTPHGKDTWPGTLSQPYLTLQHAISSPDWDTLIIRDGIYETAEPVRITRSGKPGHILVIMAENRYGAIIDANGYTIEKSSGRTANRSGIGSLHMDHVHDIRIEGIIVRNSHGIGIKVGHGSARIRLTECKAENSFNSGIGLWYCDSVMVDHCEVTGANDPAFKTATDRMRREAPHEALTVAGATHFVVKFNHVHHCYKEGIDCKEVSSHGIIRDNRMHDLPRQGLYVDCWFGLLQDVEFTRNRVHNCEWGMAISGEGRNARMKNIRVHHNLFYDNRASGIFFSVWGNDEPRDSIYIYNNTVVDNGSRGHWAGPVGGIDIRSKNLTNVWIYNNICQDNYAFEIGSSFPPDSVNQAFSERNIVVINNHSSFFKSIPDLPGDYGPVYGMTGESASEGDAKFTDRESFSISKKSPANRKGWKNGPMGYLPYIGVGNDGPESEYVSDKRTQ